MRNRNIPIRIWLNKKEQHILQNNSKMSGLCQSSYLRSLINGHVPRAQPGADFLTLYRELNVIGNNLNQIAAKANAIGFINAKDYNAVAKEVQDMTIKIYQAITQPEKLE